MTVNLNREILAAMPATVARMATLLGVSPKCVSHRLRRLKDKGLAHIGAWQATTGKPAAIWHAGPGSRAAYLLRARPRRTTGPLCVESIVASARKQPNSIFAMGEILHHKYGVLP